MSDVGVHHFGCFKVQRGILKLVSLSHLDTQGVYDHLQTVFFTSEPAAEASRLTSMGPYSQNCVVQSVQLPLKKLLLREASDFS